MSFGELHRLLQQLRLDNGQGGTSRQSVKSHLAIDFERNLIVRQVAAAFGVNAGRHSMLLNRRTTFFLYLMNLGYHYFSSTT